MSQYPSLLPINLLRANPVALTFFKTVPLSADQSPGSKGEVYPIQSQPESRSSQACQVTRTREPGAWTLAGPEKSSPVRALPGPRSRCRADRAQQRTGLCGGAPWGERRPPGRPRGKEALSVAKLEPSLQNNESPIIVLPLITF